jgi:hypothetical protein
MVTQGRAFRGRNEGPSPDSQPPSRHRYLSWELDLISSQITLEQDRQPVKPIDQLKVAFSSNIRPRLLIGMALMMLQNPSPASMRSTTTLRPSSSRSESREPALVFWLRGLFGIVKTVATTIFMLFISDRFGRRPAMLVGLAVVRPCWSVRPAPF